MEALKELWNDINRYMGHTLFKMGDANFTLGTVAYLVSGTIIVIYLSKKLRQLLVNKILPRYQMETGMAEAIATIIRYAFLLIGIFILVNSAGVDLSALGILAGALGVGIGFGLQNITNNFISGIIILFERPIKVGDRIEVADIKGDVTRISARATTVLTNDNISVIVPNSEFISSTVVNWSHSDRLVRFHFEVGVSYDEDPAKVRDLLMEVVEENDGVLKHPEADVLLTGFGDSSINFDLRVWTSEYTSRPGVLKSQLYYAIFEKFAKHGVTIPFPQRDIHIRTEKEKTILIDGDTTSGSDDKGKASGKKN